MKEWKEESLRINQPVVMPILKKRGASSCSCWHPYGGNNSKKNVNKEGGVKLAFWYLRGVCKGGERGG